MKISALPFQLPAADIAPEQLAKNPQLTEDQKVAEAARQFEAILLRQILQNTQKTVIPSKFTDNSTTSSIYHDMVTHQLADSISKSGTLGLAKTLQHQLTRQLHPVSAAGPIRKPSAQPTAPSISDAGQPLSRSAHTVAPQSRPQPLAAHNSISHRNP